MLLNKNLKSFLKLIMNSGLQPKKQETSIASFGSQLHFSNSKVKLQYKLIIKGQPNMSSFFQLTWKADKRKKMKYTQLNLTSLELKVEYKMTKI